MKNRLFVGIFAPVFIIAVIICSLTPVVVHSEGISGKVLRMHIIANSDSSDDLRLKLLVRDAVLAASESIYKDCTTLNEAISESERNLDIIKSIAKDVIMENGYSYDVSATISNEFYNTRIYDDFTLPAGVYESVRIVIGEGNGHNWWCVMYPSVCLSSCVDDFDETLTPDEKRLITSGKYVVRFKAVEVYERLKRKINLTINTK